ncbi:MAG: DUF4214 domain-containing protein, partial [Solobacterium sp.]|nr:DUF4214 domain-containing protein [Solobacterium sp.]
MMKKIVCLMLSLFCIFNSAMPIEAIERNERVSIDALQPNQISLNDPSIEGFVVRLYRFALGRNADTKGFTEWTTSLRMKRKSASEVAKSFFLSNEFTQKKIDNIEFVNLLYKTLMNRTGDVSGKVFWVKQLQIGESRAYVINQFTKSNEFQNLCAKYGIEAGKAEIVSSIGNTQIRYFVDRLYNICLNRNADLAGLNHWTSRLAQGIHTGALTVRSFFLSQEFISRNLSNHDFLKIAYQAILNRSGDASGLAYWNKMLEDGYTRDYVVAGFVKSNEFTKLCAAYGITRGSYVPDLQLVRKDDRKICVYGNGKQLTGFQRIDGKKYYFDPANGGKYHLGWLILPGSGRFYFTEDGSAKIEGQMELFGSVGRFDAEGRFNEYEE